MGRWVLSLMFVAVAGLPGCGCMEPIPPLEVAIEHPDHRTKILLNRCFADAEDCEALCREVLEDVEPERSWFEVQECELYREEDGTPVVRISYWDGSAC
jgi:hypothetical protein